MKIPRISFGLFKKRKIAFSKLIRERKSLCVFLGDDLDEIMDIFNYVCLWGKEFDSVHICVPKYYVSFLRNFELGENMTILDINYFPKDNNVILQFNNDRNIYRKLKKSLILSKNQKSNFEFSPKEDIVLTFTKIFGLEIKKAEVRFIFPKKNLKKEKDLIVLDVNYNGKIDSLSKKMAIAATHKDPRFKTKNLLDLVLLARNSKIFISTDKILVKNLDKIGINTKWVKKIDYAKFLKKRV